ncbi:acyl-coenzyme A oxidase [Beauveria bassiana ARSEF 2860]|uniref:Acyl-coenzyme A oxidase n=1 Tax=Beauveria bassiana (strain ARSEF 2860) TaxID=655819 RepID=J4KLL7_BEAB2|nr:acyl-coenzyme A oxidase [Beauveria bassiana ARSEF 2860]EJP62424.1 acyl-coenzyme A oxidase [Beauveria bassiana ARSEF 2860]
MSFPDNLKPKEPSGSSLLEKERRQSPVDVDALGKHIFAGTSFLERQARVLRAIEQEPLFDKSRQQQLSRVERVKLGLARGKLMRRLQDRHGWDMDDYHMAAYLVGEQSPYRLHVGMFRTTVEEQSSDAQRAYWMPRVNGWEVSGAYSQTELGHGSNVRGVELEARWDPAAREFVVHSPTLTAAKWWNGSLGRTANHAILMAQLMVPDPKREGQYISHGPQAFIAQIRDLKTNLPLEGVVIGDIGVKIGFTSMDNGYMLFNQFRIPHSALLSRYVQLDPETGVFSKSPNPALAYGTMTSIRTMLVEEAGTHLARAVTIAIRYTAIRQQFRDKDSQDPSSAELQVLDYPTVQVRLFPLLAAAFALQYTGKVMRQDYAKTRGEVEKGNLEGLAVMHSNSSGLKSLSTEITNAGIETCRRAMGGHGYGSGSGLVEMQKDYQAKPILEGDNWMITQQTSSFLIKRMTAAAKTRNEPPKDQIDAQLKTFLHQKDKGRTFDILNSDSDIEESFKWRAASMTYDAYEARVIKKKRHNDLLIQFHKLSHAHSQSIMVSSFLTTLTSSNDLAHETKEIVFDLYRLFAYTTIQAESYEFLRCGAASSKDLDALPERIQALLTRIRPHAVKLVDAWKIPDYLLDSALGRYDGNVYEDLFNRAHRLNPLNDIVFNPDYKDDEIVKGSGERKPLSPKL